MNLLNHVSKIQTNSNAEVVRAATEYIQQHQLPTRQQEDWKYVSVKHLSEKTFALADRNAKVSESFLKTYFAPHAANIVFVNGVLRSDLSDSLPNGLSLVQAENDKASDYVDAFDALSSLYSFSTYSLSVTKETSVDKPVHFVFWTQGDLVMSNMRMSIEVGTRTKTELMASFVGEGSEYFANTFIDINVQSSAKLSFIKIQEEVTTATHIGRLHFSVAKDADLENLVFSTGAKLAKNFTQVKLVGEGANATVHGVYTAVADQIVDNNTTIDHVVGHCNTSQLYKGLLDGESKAVFTGKVLIRKDSQKANSEQLNNNLLLTKKAEANSKPMLQIDADDVKASHGSTVGQMNKEELFYLLSRCIPKRKAIPMLSFGFLSEVIYKMANPSTQAWLEQKLQKAFKNISVESL